MEANMPIGQLSLALLEKTSIGADFVRTYG
jgi:hypothetical protein